MDGNARIKNRVQTYVELYFTCPVTELEYETDQYSLQKGYRIQTNETGEKCLAGNVAVHIPCPHCGAFHTHKVQQLGCPLEKNNK